MKALVEANATQCDEKKPACGACVRRNKVCEAWDSGFHFRNVSLSTETSSSSISSPQRVIWKSPRLKHSKERQSDGASNLHEDSKQIAPGEHTAAVSLSSAEVPYGASLPSSTSSPTSSLGNFDIIRSLNRSENELFYMTHWDASCLGALDRFFQEITFINDDYLPFKHAILALSASNMSRLRPEKGSSPATTSSHRPHPHHQITGQLYYTSAVSQVARMIKKTTPQSTSHTLAVLVIFCYIESTMGTFPGFACHSEGIETFFRTNWGALSTDTGHRLLSAYILAKLQNWWRRQNFTSFDLQLNQPPVNLSQNTIDILHSVGAQRTLITSTLCESYRLSTMALLQLWDDLRQGLNPSIAELIYSLRGESKRLDDWESMLLSAELPFESSMDFEIPGRGHHKGLAFATHYDAMNYAYYIAARIMHCLEPGSGKALILHWMTILIRVIFCLGLKDCAQRNVYSIGVSSLLMACILRCNDIYIGQWVETWLRELSRLSVLEEGSFPIAQALAVVSLLNKERSVGTEIYGVGLAEDDGGGSGKYSSYNSQILRGIMIKGSEKSTGEFFCRYRCLEASASQ